MTRSTRHVRSIGSKRENVILQGRIEQLYVRLRLLEGHPFSPEAGKTGKQSIVFAVIRIAQILDLPHDVMKIRRLVLVAAALSFVTPAAFGTVVKPLELDEMIQQADFVADVTVLKSESYKADPLVPTKIKTRVYFQVNQRIKGTVSDTFHLDFPGGTVGQITREVEGIPKIQVGQRLIIFCRNDPHAFSALVGMEQGALQVIHDDQSNVDRVYRWWGQPVNESEAFSTKKAVSAATRADYLRSAESVQAFTQRLSRKINQ